MATSPSGDTVEELRVQTTMFDAAYGRSNGGVVIYATRSGNNELHGSFEGFYRNKALNANSWLNNRRGLPRPDDPRKFYSGTLGGPIYLPKVYDGRNRTFFFTSVQHDSRWSNPTYGGRVPTELERQGDFSQTLNARGTPLTIYNVFTTRVEGTTVIRQPWPGNRIPASMFNETGAAIMNVYPKPNPDIPAQIGRHNWFELSRAYNPAKQISQRIDHLISPKHRIFGRFAYMDWDVTFTKLPPGLRNAPVGGDPGGDLRRFWNATLNQDYTFAPTVIGTLRFSFNRYWSDTWFSGNVQDPKALKLHPDILANQMRPSWPGIDMAEGFIRLGHRFKIRANDTYVLTPTLTTLRRAHNLRIGADVRRLNWNEISPDSHGRRLFQLPADVFAGRSLCPRHQPGERYGHGRPAAGHACFGSDFRPDAVLHEGLLLRAVRAGRLENRAPTDSESRTALGAGKAVDGAFQPHELRSGYRDAQPLADSRARFARRPAVCGRTRQPAADGQNGLEQPGPPLRPGLPDLRQDGDSGRLLAVLLQLPRQSGFHASRSGHFQHQHSLHRHHGSRRNAVHDAGQSLPDGSPQADRRIGGSAGLGGRRDQRGGAGPRAALQPAVAVRFPAGVALADQGGSQFRARAQRQRHRVVQPE
jgi:hypothetical protein